MMTPKSPFEINWPLEVGYWANQTWQFFNKVRILASCSNLRIRHDSENAAFWPRALQMQKLAMLLPLTLKSKSVFFLKFYKDWLSWFKIVKAAKSPLSCNSQIEFSVHVQRRPRLSKPFFPNVLPISIFHSISISLEIVLIAILSIYSPGFRFFCKN